MQKKYEPLYNIDSKGKVRIWWMEQDGDSYRTVSGIEGGNLVESAWKKALPKNVGRANSTTGIEQASAEIASQYTKKQDNKYFINKNEVGRSKIVQPMLAGKFKNWKAISSYHCYSQPKLDGMRCIATKEGLFSRAGKPIVTCAHIVQELADYFDAYPDAIIDGELYNHDLADDFNELISLIKQQKPTAEDLQRAKENVQYHIYDFADENVFSVRYKKNMGILDQYLSYDLDYIRFVETVPITDSEHLDKIYGHYLESGYEGQMIRLDNDSYLFKRTDNLLKRKEFVDAEFKVLEIIEGKGNWAGYAKSVRCVDDHGVEFRAGIKGSQDFTKNLLQGPAPDLTTVRYQNKTPDGSYRFPIAVSFYWGERDY